MYPLKNCLIILMKKINKAECETRCVRLSSTKEELYEHLSVWFFSFVSEHLTEKNVFCVIRILVFGIFRMFGIPTIVCCHTFKHFAKQFFIFGLGSGGGSRSFTHSLHLLFTLKNTLYL